MKLIHVLVAIVLVLVGWFAWRNLPGVRTRVENTVEEYGGWTQEARESDPQEPTVEELPPVERDAGAVGARYRRHGTCSGSGGRCGAPAAALLPCAGVALRRRRGPAREIFPSVRPAFGQGPEHGNLIN